MLETTAAQDPDPFEADFALGGEVEFEEQEGATDAELETLMAGVRAAGHSGA
jgi:hypothetical protein